MKVVNTPDYSVTDHACDAATGKTLVEWYLALDAADGLKIGRRGCTSHIGASVKDAWWPTTIAVEYERHHGVTKKDGLLEGYSICATKTVAVPPERAYAVWTDPASFAGMFGDNGSQDVQEGGAIGCDAGCKGTFTRVRPGKDLRFSWEHPGCTASMVVDVMFQDAKGKTLMNVMTARIQTRAETDGLRAAWGEALTRFKQLCESG